MYLNTIKIFQNLFTAKKMPENNQPVHHRLGERGRSPIRSQHKKRSLLQGPPIRPREASSLNRGPPTTRVKYSKNFETDTPEESTYSKSHNHPPYYEPPSMTYGQMSKELKKHKSNSKNLAKINEDLKSKNKKLERDLSAEKKVSESKDETIRRLKLSNADYERQLADDGNEKKKLAKIIRVLERENDEYVSEIKDQQDVIDKYRKRLDRSGDENLRSFRKRREDKSDW